MNYNLHNVCRSLGLQERQHGTTLGNTQGLQLRQQTSSRLATGNNQWLAAQQQSSGQ